MADPARSCIKVQCAASDKPFFVSVSKHGMGPEDTSVDLAVTDASGAWTSPGKAWEPTNFFGKKQSASLH